MSRNPAISKNLRCVYLVPSLPHVLQKTASNDGYQALHSAYGQIAAHLAASGVQRLVYYSTGWIAVLGQMLQARAQLQGVHVDENWYEYGDLTFAMKVDVGFAKRTADVLQSAGMAVQTVDFEGFPLDTGTVVADHLLNQGRYQTAVIANHVYSDFAQTRKIAALVRKQIEADEVPTAVVGISGMSGSYFTDDIDLREDRFGGQEDDAWNRRLLDLLRAGKWAEAEQLIPAYARATKADMGMKVLAFITGLGLEARDQMPDGLWPGHDGNAPRQAQVLAYAPIYGTGAAVIEF